MGDVMAEFIRMEGVEKEKASIFHKNIRCLKPLFGSLVLSFSLVSGVLLAHPAHAADDLDDLEFPGADQLHPMELAGLSTGGLKLDSRQASGGLVNPQITRSKLRMAGFIIPETESVASIIGSTINSDAMKTGSIVFIDIGRKQGVVEGDLFSVFIKDELIRHPHEMVESPEAAHYYERPLGLPSQTYFTAIGRPMGYMVEILGTLEVIETTDDMSKAIVQESYSDIPLGSLITPYQKTPDPVTRQQPKENMSLEGVVVAIKGKKYAGGLTDIVYADFGSKDNVTPGDRFEAYIIPTTDTKVWNHLDPLSKPLMTQVVAQLQVLATQEDTATLYVEKNENIVEVGQRLRYKPIAGVTQAPNVAALGEAPTYIMEEGFREESVGAGNGEVSDDEIAEPFPFAGQGGENGAGETGADGAGRGAAGSGADEMGADGLTAGGAQAEEAKLLDFHPTTELKDILFKFDRFDLDEASITLLKNNAQYLKEHPTVKIQIQGHSDERGTNNYNLALGERRSTSIKNFLVSQGIEPERIFVLSYGEEKPFCFENNESCWQQNRRAHFMVTEEHGESKF